MLLTRYICIGWIFMDTIWNAYKWTLTSSNRVKFYGQSIVPLKLNYAILFLEYHVSRGERVTHSFHFHLNRGHEKAPVILLLSLRLIKPMYLTSFWTDHWHVKQLRTASTLNNDYCANSQCLHHILSKMITVQNHLGPVDSFDAVFWKCTLTTNFSDIRWTKRHFSGRLHELLYDVEFLFHANPGTWGAMGTILLVRNGSLHHLFIS